MSIADDKLEILMGKLLDGAITPAEQRLLESELEHNPQARELLEQLRTLHECSREAVARAVFRQGADPQEIFNRAWQQHRKSWWRRTVRADGHLLWGSRTRHIVFREGRFAVGLAAGFLLGFLLHFVLVGQSKPPAEMTMRPPVAKNLSVGIRPATEPEATGQVMRNVDWYGFTDRTGNQWLVEGVREGMVRPAAYYGDL